MLFEDVIHFGTQLEAENEVNNEMANRMSLFYAEATPMLKTLSNATTKFVSEVDSPFFPSQIHIYRKSNVSRLGSHRVGTFSTDLEFLIIVNNAKCQNQFIRKASEKLIRRELKV